VLTYICVTSIELQAYRDAFIQNMDAPLQDCTTEVQRGTVRFLWGRRSETCGNSQSLCWLSMDRAPRVNERFMSGWKGLNRVEHVLLMKVVLVAHQHRAAEKLLLRRNTETS